jgi:cyclopropane-fatty-acyl-phospholipid synthase
MNLIPSSIIASQLFKTLEGLEYGKLKVITPEGRTYAFAGPKPGPAAEFIIHDWKVIRNAMTGGDIALGEDYIAGLWTTESIENLFAVFMLNMDQLDGYAHGDWMRRISFLIYNRIICRNNRRGSSKNIKAHYDVGNEFYKLWLDETMTYSSALYNQPDNDLKTAQQAKYRRILSKLNDGAESVLEIGCGWGGFAEEATRDSRKVTGLTVSPAQHAYATERLAGNADIRLQDYRDTGGTFDAIVSIEMFEAVGEKYWPTYFKAVAERLKRGGKAVIQTITIGDEFFNDYRTRSDFIRHYVFPGGMLPSAQRFREEAEKAGLKCVDTFAFGQDYAKTLREWSKRIDEKRADILNMGYNESFIRNWQFYLGICAAAFAINRTNVVQMELAHAA